MTAPLIMILAGGTGGHVYPGLALADELRARGYRLHWIGTRRGLEDRVVTGAGIPLSHLPMRGLRGKGITDRLLALLLLGVSLVQAFWLTLRCWPRAVVGLGGYVTVPAGVAAWLLRRPLMLQEQNAVAGSANRALAPLARCVATGFPDVLTRYRARWIGNPVRADLVALAGRLAWNWDGQRPLQILVLGGSLGARAINDAIPAATAALGDRCVWWQQCGPANEEAARAAAKGLPEAVSLRVEPFLDDMPAAYRWADLVVCRAGALTVAELAVVGRPAVLVPLPGAIDDHQRLNAQFLAGGGAAELLPQSELEAGGLAPCLEALLAAPERLATMAARARELGRPDATRELADCCEALLR